MIKKLCNDDIIMISLLSDKLRLKTDSGLIYILATYTSETVESPCNFYESIRIRVTINSLFYEIK